MQSSGPLRSHKRSRALTQDEAFTDWSSDLIGPTPNPFASETDVYTVPVGTNLFHGAPYHVNPDHILERPNFFGDWRTASVYHLSNDDGRCIHRYTVYQPIVVLALDSCRTIRTGGFSLSNVSFSNAVSCSWNPLDTNRWRLARTYGRQPKRSDRRV